MGEKIIVTHMAPDLDAVTACWLIKKFWPHWENSRIDFAPAGKTLNNQSVDADPNVIHVDTGLGRFDHHQLTAKTCASSLVLKHLVDNRRIGKKDKQALERLVEVVRKIDNFEDFFWEKPESDRYDLFLPMILDNLKHSGKTNDLELISIGMIILDAVLRGLKEKIAAEKEINKGQEFETIWGRSLGVESQISRISKLAQKKGYVLVVRKDGKTGLVSVKCQPRDDLDLKPAYKALKKADPRAGWFFHQSRHMIINGSIHNPEVKPSSLSLKELIEILKEVKGGVIKNASGG